MQPIGDGALLVDMRSGVCFELNRTGAEVWELLASGGSVESICAALAGRYQLPAETIASDVRGIIEALKKQQLIEPSAPAPEKT